MPRASHCAPPRGRLPGGIAQGGDERRVGRHGGRSPWAAERKRDGREFNNKIKNHNNRERLGQRLKTQKDGKARRTGCRSPLAGGRARCGVPRGWRSDSARRREEGERGVRRRREKRTQISAERRELGFAPQCFRQGTDAGLACIPATHTAAASPPAPARGPKTASRRASPGEGRSRVAGGRSAPQTAASACSEAIFSRET